MTLRRYVKALGGAVTLLVFLGLVIADTIDAGVTLSFQDRVWLLTLIGALLGLDKLLERVPKIGSGFIGGKNDE